MKMFILPLLATTLLGACANESGNADADAPAVAAPATPAAPGMDATSMSESTEATASGTVESVDPQGGRIVIAHGPVDALDWPAMTMGFKATPEQIQAVQAGQRVTFDFDSEGSNNTITRIEPLD